MGFHVLIIICHMMIAAEAGAEAAGSVAIEKIEADRFIQITARLLCFPIFIARMCSDFDRNKFRVD